LNWKNEFSFQQNVTKQITKLLSKKKETSCPPLIIAGSSAEIVLRFFKLKKTRNVRKNCFSEFLSQKSKKEEQPTTGTKKKKKKAEFVYFSKNQFKLLLFFSGSEAL
jgi:hypothetical protein